MTHTKRAAVSSEPIHLPRSNIIVFGELDAYIPREQYKDHINLFQPNEYVHKLDNNKGYLIKMEGQDVIDTTYVTKDFSGKNQGDLFMCGTKVTSVTINYGKPYRQVMVNYHMETDDSIIKGGQVCVSNGPDPKHFYYEPTNIRHYEYDIICDPHQHLNAEECYSLQDTMYDTSQFTTFMRKNDLLYPYSQIYKTQGTQFDVTYTLDVDYINSIRITCNLTS